MRKGRAIRAIVIGNEPTDLNPSLDQTLSTGALESGLKSPSKDGDRRTLQEGFGKDAVGGCVLMESIEHGDLIEQRRGGVDVLRVLVRNLAVSRTIRCCLHTLLRFHSRLAWAGFFFRLGQPVMAFHSGQVQNKGLEALLAIEQDALEVENSFALQY